MGPLAKVVSDRRKTAAVVSSFKTGERHAQSDIYRASRDKSRMKSVLPGLPGGRGRGIRGLGGLRRLNNFNMPGNGLGVPNMPGGGGIGTIPHPKLLGMGKHHRVSKGTNTSGSLKLPGGHAAAIAKQTKMNLPTTYRPLSKQPYGLG
jgi:hypothetical protein